MTEAGRDYMETFLNWVGFSGIASGLALIFMGGRLSERVRVLETFQSDFKDVPATLARIDERLRATQTNVEGLREDFIRREGHS